MTQALVRAGIEAPGAVVEIRRPFARRPVLLAAFDDGSALLLKWLGHEDDSAGDNEVVMLGLLAKLALAPTLADALPRVVSYDAGQRLLVLEGSLGLETFHEAAVSGRGLSDERLVQLAAVLAALHSLDVDALRRRHPDRQIFLPIQPMLDLSPAEFACGPGLQYADYAAAVQAVDAEIRELVDAWRPACLTHFDVRDDNVLVAPPADRRPDPLRLVDWELAGFGDPLYDVGTVVGQFVYHSLRKQRMDDATDRALPARQVSCFVEAYGRLTGAGTTPTLAAGVLRYAGVFLFLRALATLHVAGALGPAGRLSLLLGRRFLSHPERSAELLLA